VAVSFRCQPISFSLSPGHFFRDELLLLVVSVVWMTFSFPYTIRSPETEWVGKFSCPVRFFFFFFFSFYPTSPFFLVTVSPEGCRRRSFGTTSPELVLSRHTPDFAGPFLEPPHNADRPLGRSACTFGIPHGERSQSQSCRPKVQESILLLCPGDHSDARWCARPPAVSDSLRSEKLLSSALWPAGGTGGCQ